MRIALLAPPFYEVPPQGYGGTERVCAMLANGLVDVGHEVILIGAGAHRTRVQRFVPTFELAQPEGTPEEVTIEVIHAARAQAVLDAFDVDIVHDHTRAGLLCASSRRAQTVATVHCALSGPDSQPALYRALGTRVPLVAISHAQRRSAPDLPWLATVHHGVDVEEFHFRRRPDKESFVLYLGRLNALKGVDVAIDAAQAAGVPIVLAGSWTVPAEREYLEAVIRPRLGRDVEWIGEVQGVERLDILSRAGCVICPALWSEPFGLVIVEAMASGTPVVALQAGAVDEIVVNGITGVVTHDRNELAGAIRLAMTLEPAACRSHVAAHFSVASMVDGYEAAYQATLRQADVR